MVTDGGGWERSLRTRVVRLRQSLQGIEVPSHEGFALGA